MNRENNLDRIRRRSEPWDVVVAGGGATGLGVAVEAASRGCGVVLLERDDFAKGTSSRSTKLVHGGVRYLRQGDVGLVRDALRERGLLLRNAPHLSRPLPFVLPVYRWWEAPFYLTGLKVYDLLAGKLSLGRSRYLSRDHTLKRVPSLLPDGLIGGVIYYDAQFDDARLALALARTASDFGAVPLNYFQVTGVLKRQGRVCGVEARDLESGETHAVQARAVVNATGVFCDELRRLDDPAAKPVISPSRGAHVVLDRSFLPGDCAVVFPETDDGRVLFALPWENRTLLGTTDEAVDRLESEPRPDDREIDFLIEHAARFLTKAPTRSDILSVFAGLRPLVASDGGHATKSLSRDHVLMVAPSGMVTITGGKWTTYRKMAEETVDRCIAEADLQARPSATRELKLHGWTDRRGQTGFDFYGAETDQLQALAASEPKLAERVHPALPCVGAEVVWAVRHEMARTVEDVLSRRTRCLLLDAQAAIEAAPAVARLMAGQLQRDAQWEARQVADFKAIAKRYLPPK